MNESKLQSVKRLLYHYFSLASFGVEGLAEHCEKDAEAVVDMIIDCAMEEAADRLSRYRSDETA